MPVTLGALTANRAEADIAIGAGVLHVTYRPAAISPATFHRVLEMDAPLVGADGGEPTIEQVLERVDSAVTILLPLLESWDLQEPDEHGEPSGRPVPLNRRTLSELGLPVLWQIVSGVLEDSRLGGKTGTASQPVSHATSAPKARTSSRRRA